MKLKIKTFIKGSRKKSIKRIGIKLKTSIYNIYIKKEHIEFVNVFFYINKVPKYKLKTKLNTYE